MQGRSGGELLLFILLLPLLRLALFIRRLLRLPGAEAWAARPRRHVTCRRDRRCWLQLTEQQPAMSLRRRRRRGRGRIRRQWLRGQRRQRRDQHNYKSVGEATQRMRTTTTTETAGVGRGELCRIVPSISATSTCGLRV